MTDLPPYDLAGYGTRHILRARPGETQDEYTARRATYQMEGHDMDMRVVNPGDYDPISKRWLDVDELQRYYHEDALRHDLARDHNVEEYTGAIVILDYVEAANIGWECDSKFVIARIDGELLLRGLDSVEVKDDRIAEELSKQLDLYRDLSGKTTDFLTFWQRLNSGQRISPLDTHVEEQKLGAIQDLRGTIAHVLAKLSDVRIDLQKLIGVADSLWLVAQEDDAMKPALEGLDIAIGDAISALVNEFRLQDRKADHERFLSHVRARRDGESDEDWLARMRRFGIEVDDE